MTHTLHFVVEKETKGAVRYKEVNLDGTDTFDPKVATLYVRKSAMRGKIVPAFTMTLTPVE